MSKDRSEYQRAYYEANKLKKKERRKPQPRTEAMKLAEIRCRKKKQLLAAIDSMPIPTIDSPPFIAHLTYKPKNFA